MGGGVACAAIAFVLNTMCLKISLIARFILVLIGCDFLYILLYFLYPASIPLCFDVVSNDNL